MAFVPDRQLIKLSFQLATQGLQVEKKTIAMD